MTSVGLTDPALVLHSFRHAGITRCHEVGISEAHAWFLQDTAAAVMSIHPRTCTGSRFHWLCCGTV
jgi:hypothetical protein